MVPYLLTAAVIALGAAAVVRAKRRAHEEWLRRTGGVITGEAQGDPSKRPGGTATYGGANGGTDALVEEADYELRPDGVLLVQTARRLPVIVPFAAGYSGRVGSTATFRALDADVLFTGLDFQARQRGARVNAGDLVGYARPGQTFTIAVERGGVLVDPRTFFRSHLVNIASRSAS
jgi:hypothetical protein